MNELFTPVALSTVETWVQGNGWDALIKFLENPLGIAAIIAAVGYAVSSCIGASRAHGTARTR